MHKAIVKVHYGYACPRRTKKEYKNAKSIMCMGCVVGPYRLAIKYHCQQCDKLKKADKAYWKQHDKERKIKHFRHCWYFLQKKLIAFRLWQN